MENTPQFKVNPDTVKQNGDMLHGVVGEYNGKPVAFTYDSIHQEIIIPEELEPLYPVIEAAVVEYLNSSKENN